MENTEIIVEFDKYCKTCKHKELEDKYDPCCDCLDNPTNINSRKPIHYEEDEKLVKEEEKKNNVEEG